MACALYDCILIAYPPPLAEVKLVSVSAGEDVRLVYTDFDSRHAVPLVPSFRAVLTV